MRRPAILLSYAMPVDEARVSAREDENKWISAGHDTAPNYAPMPQTSFLTAAISPAHLVPWWSSNSLGFGSGTWSLKS